MHAFEAQKVWDFRAKLKWHWFPSVSALFAPENQHER
jgi:hypothetical protein